MSPEIARTVEQRCNELIKPTQPEQSQKPNSEKTDNKDSTTTKKNSDDEATTPNTSIVKRQIRMNPRTSLNRSLVLTDGRGM